MVFETRKSCVAAIILAVIFLSLIGLESVQAEEEVQKSSALTVLSTVSVLIYAFISFIFPPSEKTYALLSCSTYFNKSANLVTTSVKHTTVIPRSAFLSSFPFHR